MESAVKSAVKIAIVWNHPSRLLDCSFRFEQYAAGFQALGHQTFLVCHRGCEEGYPEAYGVEPLCVEPSRLQDTAFWQDLGADVAVLVTWHRMSAELSAARRAGVRTLAITDSDGQVGLRAHPRMTWVRMWFYLDGLRERLRCVRYFVGRWLKESLRGSPEDREMIASTRESDIVVFGSEASRQAFRRLLVQEDAISLDSKMVIAPLLIGASFFERPITAKKKRITAIGRWDDPQKDVELMVAALKHFFLLRRDVEVVIFGAGGEELFAPLLDEPLFFHRGLQPQAVLAESLAQSRTVVFSSRWEGSPHAAVEALVLGGTIVGTPVPALVSWTEEGRFGRIAAADPHALGDALAAEMQAWDDGERDAGEITQVWRSRLDPEEICRRMLARFSRPMKMS